MCGGGGRWGAWGGGGDVMTVDVTWKYMPTSTIEVFAMLSTVIFLTLNVDASCAWHGPLTSVNNILKLCGL